MGLYTVSTGATALAADLNQYDNLMTGVMTDQPVSVGNIVQGTALGVTGLTGSTSPVRLVGANAGGPPTTGAHVVGDLAVDPAIGRLWLCAIAGTPGSWFLTGNGPSTRVFNSANESINDSVNTVLTFDSERYKSDTAMHSTSSNTGRLIAPFAGRYLITGHISFASNSSGARIVLVRYNGTATLAQETQQAVGQSEMSIATVYKMASNDYVELLAQQQSGAALNVMAVAASSPEFTLSWLGNG